MPLHIIVEHHQPEFVKILQADLLSANLEIDKLKSELRSLEHKFGWEVTLNGELIDLLNQHNIPYRSLLDYSKHPF